MSTYVIGIDGGGSHTRVVVADDCGKLLSYVQKGGCNRYHDSHADQHVLGGIAEALEQAGIRPEQVAAIQAGMAGLDRDEEFAWAEGVLAKTGITGRRSAVNDTLIAHTAAFNGEPGIVAIGGTGSLILGRTEEDAWIRNDQFGHYAPTAARFLSYDAVHSVLAGRYEQQDQPFIEQILAYWNVHSVQELTALGAAGFAENKQEMNRKFSQMAPLVTEAANRQTPLAMRVCESAADTAVVGILMLSGCFRSEKISYTLNGSCLTSPYMVAAVRKGLALNNQTTGRTFQYITSELPAVGGALLEAYHLAGIQVKEGTAILLQEQLKRYST
ncbi:BadF/BadG/BcrA/BcrD ATPase family protein [Paenibacillus xylanilyticus]|uniref:BadF/BadG/BcrA/BcrD ATPase family protein n=1 Tax=Paenibacillus xylanilyticus TaxID=248903 RepID=UPI00399F277F